MKKNTIGFIIGIYFAVSAGPFLSADTGGGGKEIISAEPQQVFGGILKLRIFEGLREGGTPAQSITSSYPEYLLSADIPSSDAALKIEQRQIKKTFNLKDVKLVTESKVSWRTGEPQEARQMIRLDGKLYLVAIRSENVLARRFHVVVSEVLEKKSGDTFVTSNSEPLLDTEFTIPQKNIAVFGFEDSTGEPYFISFREESIHEAIRSGTAGGVSAGVEGGVEGGVVGGVLGGVVGGVAAGIQSEEMEKKREEFRKEAASIKDARKQPKLIRKAMPVYPEDARKDGIQGVVILEVKINEQGRVMDVMVLSSVPALDQAAIDAVKQWVYEPVIIDGKPTKAFFTVTVKFQLDKEDIEKFAEGAVKVTDAIPPPPLIKKVNPVYPEAARKAGIEGVVILEARTDVEGRMKNVRILRSVPMLDQAAIDAVRQWVYEPMIIEGQAKEAVFTITVRFNLNGKRVDKEADKTSTGDVLIPKLIKKVDPVYPGEARKAGIQGVVLLEATTDEKGNVAAVRVLESIPALDQAAIAALKQWKYEPFIIEGKPKGVVFTVTIRFRLQ